MSVATPPSSSSSSPLKNASQRFAIAAQEKGLQLDILTLQVSTRTAQEAAQAVACDLSQIVKSLIFRGRTTNTPLLLLVSGANRVNEKGVTSHIGEKLTRPNADDVRALTGYAIGGIPPFGHLTSIKTFIDQDLLAHSEVWAAAGTPNSMFAISPEQLQSVTAAQPLIVT